MSGQGNAARTEVSRREAAAQGRAEGLNIGWTVFGYLLSGMAGWSGALSTCRCSSRSAC
jgi:hypothetical protein